MNLGVAIELLKDGRKMAREGWNGKGLFLQLQNPDANSLMTGPYIYIDSTRLDTQNSSAPKLRVPWVASQTDLLAEDWMIVIF